MPGKRILVVDDDGDFLESLQLALISGGHRTIQASGGREAVEKYAEYEPDLVLLDFRMPGIDGYETFLRIMKQDPGARVVLTSAYAVDDGLYREAKSRSLAGMLSKPVGAVELEEAIRRHSR